MAKQIEMIYDLVISTLVYSSFERIDLSITRLLRVDGTRFKPAPTYQTEK